jgi:hypothetical protein
MDPMVIPPEEDTPVRRTQRALTQRYDMATLRAVQKIEEEFAAKAGQVLGCDEDEVPFAGDMDMLGLFNSEPATRRDTLVCLHFTVARHNIWFIRMCLNNRLAGWAALLLFFLS